MNRCSAHWRPVYMYVAHTGEEACVHVCGTHWRGGLCTCMWYTPERRPVYMYVVHTGEEACVHVCGTHLGDLLTDVAHTEEVYVQMWYIPGRCVYRCGTH